MQSEVNRNGNTPAEEGVSWYCLRSRRKQEHIAAAHVRILGNVPVYCPRISFRRATKNGSAVRVTEALFPGYFFARFSLSEMLLRVRSAHGVSGIVQFGTWYPVIDDSTIDELRAETDTGTVNELPPDLMPGDRVRLVVGPLAGLEAVITHVLPGNERVRLLLEFLGGHTQAEAKARDVIPYDQIGTTVLGFAARLAITGRHGRLDGANILLPTATSANAVLPFGA